MSLLLHCPTSEALIICGVRDAKGILRIPIQSQELPGVQFSPEQRLAINPQIMQELGKILQVEAPERHIDIEQRLTLKMTLNNQTECTVYLAQLKSEGRSVFGEYPKIVDVLRAFPANQNRRTLLQAFQYFSSGLEDNLRALTREDLM